MDSTEIAAAAFAYMEAGGLLHQVPKLYLSLEYDIYQPDSPTLSFRVGALGYFTPCVGQQETIFYIARVNHVDVQNLDSRGLDFHVHASIKLTIFGNITASDCSNPFFTHSHIHREGYDSIAAPAYSIPNQTVTIDPDDIPPPQYSAME